MSERITHWNVIRHGPRKYELHCCICPLSLCTITNGSTTWAAMQRHRAHCAP